jgi:hypothetical protein
MGEIIEGLALLFGGIYLVLGKAYEKTTGKELGILGVLVTMLMSAVLCCGATWLILRMLFPPGP